jgi:ribosomal protein L12E/L44/L45/RPP1/RPP2
MGRFTSVQAYADNNANLRKLTYEQATGVKDSSSGNSGEGGSGSANANAGAGPPLLKGDVQTEKVINPYGSTAGAGSGEFHVYRHARAREMARWKHLDERQREEKLQLEFQSTIQHNQELVNHKSDKNRKKRQREREAKERKKHLQAAGIILGGSAGQSLPGDDPITTITATKKAAATAATRTRTQRNNAIENVDADQEPQKDFIYVPVVEQQQQQRNAMSTNGGMENETDNIAEIPRDGSFLEVMKRKLEGVNSKKSTIQSSAVTAAVATAGGGAGAAADIHSYSSGAKRSLNKNDNEDEGDDGPMLLFPPTNSTNDHHSTALIEGHDSLAISVASSKKARIIETKIFDEEF